MLGVGGWFFQGFHISTLPTTGENFKKVSEVDLIFDTWWDKVLQPQNGTF